MRTVVDPHTELKVMIASSPALTLTFPSSLLYGNAVWMGSCFLCLFVSEGRKMEKTMHENIRTQTQIVAFIKQHDRFHEIHDMRCKLVKEKVKIITVIWYVGSGKWAICFYGLFFNRLFDLSDLFWSPAVLPLVDIFTVAQRPWWLKSEIWESTLAWSFHLLIIFSIVMPCLLFCLCSGVVCSVHWLTFEAPLSPRPDGVS